MSVRTRDLLSRWKYAIGYVFIVLVAVGASQIAEHHSRRDLNRHDQISCEQRAALAHNQIDELHVLLTLPLSAARYQTLLGDLEQLTRVIARGC